MLDMPANAPGSIVEWLSSLPCIETVRVLRLSRPWNVPAGRVSPSITSMLSSCRLTSPVKSPGCGGVSKSIAILPVMRKSSGSVIAWQDGILSTLNSLFCIVGLRPQMPGPAGTGEGTGVATAVAIDLGVPVGVLVKAGLVLVGVAAGCIVAWDAILLGVGVGESVARLFRSCCSRSVFWVSASSFWSSSVRDARLPSFWSRSVLAAPTTMTMVPSMAAVSRIRRHGGLELFE